MPLWRYAKEYKVVSPVFSPRVGVYKTKETSVEIENVNLKSYGSGAHSGPQSIVERNI